MLLKLNDGHNFLWSASLAFDGETFVSGKKYTYIESQFCQAVARNL